MNLKWSSLVCLMLRIKIEDTKGADRNRYSQDILYIQLITEQVTFLCSKQYFCMPSIVCDSTSFSVYERSKYFFSPICFNSSIHSAHIHLRYIIHFDWPFELKGHSYKHTLTSMVDTVQTIDHTIGFCCFSAEHTPIRLERG